MKVPVNQFSNAVGQYLMQHVIPAIKNPVDRFSAGLAAGKLKASIPGMIDRLGAPYVQDGMVCLNEIEAALKQGFSVLEGGKLPIPIPSTGKVLANLFGPENKPLADAALSMFGMGTQTEGEMVFSEADWHNFKTLFG